MKGQIPILGSTVQVFFFFFFFFFNFTCSPFHQPYQQLCENPRITEKHPAPFAITTVERTYFLSAEKEQEREGWVEEIEKFSLSRKRMSRRTISERGRGGERPNTNL